jgi:hypothetical protein
LEVTYSKQGQQKAIHFGLALTFTLLLLYRTAEPLPFQISL